MEKLGTRSALNSRCRDRGSDCVALAGRCCSLVALALRARARGGVAPRCWRDWCDRWPCARWAATVPLAHAGRHGAGAGRADADALFRALAGTASRAIATATFSSRIAAATARRTRRSGRRSQRARRRAARASARTLVQRELLLDTMVQNTPVAMVLIDAAGHVVYANLAARQMLGDGREARGPRLRRRWSTTTPAALQEAVARRRATLFSLERRRRARRSTTCRAALPSQRPRRTACYLFQRLTARAAPAGSATWKKVIRVISHELNNSLAPIASLAHSGASCLRADPDTARLDSIFATIEERARHLKAFLRGYARSPSCPRRGCSRVPWARVPRAAAQQVDFSGPATSRSARRGSIRRRCEQALINLLKNAHESGSPPDGRRARGACARRSHDPRCRCSIAAAA